MEEFRDVKTWLVDAHNIHVSDDWLSACLEFIQQETNGSLDSAGQLRSLVFEQWLCSDLSEIGEPTLPLGISDTKKLDLVSSYPLQLISVVDVGFPLYGQKQKLQGKDNPNVNVSADKAFQPGWEPKPCRMLMMKLTDGHECIDAIEYQQIRAINAGLPAGTKIIVTGPLLCRRGVMMLTEENVQVLGGEVDALIETNTMLSNLETLMEKNRLDEGKTSTLKLSGKFLTRGSDEKGDLKCKSFVKQEQNSSKTRRSDCDSQYGGRPGVSQIKREPKMEFQSLNVIKDEMNIKCKDDKDFQWEDDIDYDALFDDAMNCMDDMPSNTAASQPKQQSQPSSRMSSGDRDKQKFDKTGIKTNTFPIMSTTKSECRSSAITPSSAPHSKFQLRHVDDTYFDDDLDGFDIDDIEDSFSPCRETVPLSESMNSAETIRNQQQAITEKNVNRRTSAPLGLSENFALPSGSDPPSSSRLSQLSGRLNMNQSSSVAIHPSQKTSNNKELLCSVPTEQNSTQQSSKRETLSHTLNSSSSGKWPMSEASLPKKSKQSKIYDWGISSSNKDATPDSLTTQSDKFETLPESSPSNIIPKTDTYFISPSNLSLDINRCGSGLADADKNAVVISGLSTTSSVEFSSPKVKELPKAVIHPFTDTDEKTSDSFPERPFEYLNDLSTHAPGEAVIVKAYISTLTDKLRCAGGQTWTLSCRINDGTACLDVNLDSKVLTELIGFSAQESIAMRQKMKSDPTVKDVLMNGLTQCQNKLINISCLMKIVTSSSDSKPTVTQLTPVTLDCVQQLQQRVASLSYC